jgi:hypothetical protein
VPYNTSKACVVRYLRYLQDMAEARTTLTWPASDSEIFARKLREAMAAARHHEEFGYLHDLKDFFRIRPRSGWVEAEYIGPPEKKSVPRVPDRMEVKEATSAPGVVGACIKFAARANEIHFPNAITSEDDKLAIYNWGLGEVPQWKLISHDDKGVTMTRKRAVDKTFLWKPKEEET